MTHLVNIASHTTYCILHFSILAKQMQIIKVYFQCLPVTFFYYYKGVVNYKFSELYCIWKFIHNDFLKYCINHEADIDLSLVLIFWLLRNCVIYSNLFSLYFKYVYFNYLQLKIWIQSFELFYCRISFTVIKFLYIAATDRYRYWFCRLHLI